MVPKSSQENDGAAAITPEVPVSTPDAPVAIEDRRPKHYRDWPGSLDKDIAFKSHEIKDDDERWEVLTPGLKKLQLRVADETSSPKPVDGELVSVHYSTFLHPTGELIATSRKLGDGKFHKFEVGKGQVIKGLEVAVLTMPIGERAIFRCAPDYAYGKNGFTPSGSSEEGVPPDAVVDMVVQVEWVVQYEPLKDGGVCKSSIVHKTYVETSKFWKPAEYQTVTVSYAGREVDEKGRLFCEGTDEEILVPLDIEFEGKGWIEDYDHPRAFYHCLKHVREGETMYFKIQSSQPWTYGVKGNDKFDIQDNTELFYSIRVKDMGISLLDNPIEEEKIERLTELKNMANAFYRRNKLKASRRVYKEILRMSDNNKSKPAGNGIPTEKPEPAGNGIPTEKPEAEEVDTKEAELRAIRVACYANSALVELKLKNLGEAEDNITSGLDLDPEHEKLQYRKALLHFERAEFEEAIKLLERLETKFPENQKVKSLKSILELRQKGAKRKIKGVAKKMFRSNPSSKGVFFKKLNLFNITAIWSSALVFGGLILNLKYGTHIAYKVLLGFGIVFVGLTGFSDLLGGYKERFDIISSLLVNLVLAGVVLKTCIGSINWLAITVPLCCIALSVFYVYRLQILSNKLKGE